MDRRTFLRAVPVAALAATVAPAVLIPRPRKHQAVVFVDGRAPFRLFGNRGTVHDPMRRVADALDAVQPGGQVYMTSTRVGSSDLKRLTTSGVNACVLDCHLDLR